MTSPTRVLPAGIGLLFLIAPAFAQTSAQRIVLEQNGSSPRQEGSVRVGLHALSGPFDAIFIVPSDQPLLAAGDLTELIGAFKKRPTGHVVVPVVNGQRGNPILLDEVAHAQILASGMNLGCRHLIDSHPELVHAYETPNTRFITDLDTLEDVHALAERTGWRLELPALAAVQ